jgi:hypothetical protein
MAHASLKSIHSGKTMAIFSLIGVLGVKGGLGCAQLRTPSIQRTPFKGNLVLCKNKGKTMQNCRKHTGGPKRKPWKLEWHKPRVKVKTGAHLAKRGFTLKWHTPLSRPLNRGRLCKNEGRTMQNCGKHTGGLKKKTWSSTTQE